MSLLKVSSVSPGEIIEEYLGWYELDNFKLAKAIDIDVVVVDEILAARLPVTSEIALGLERVLKRPAQFWLNLQSRYDQSRSSK